MLILYFIGCILQPICLPVPEMMLVLWASQTIGEVPSFLVGLLGTIIGISIMYHLSGKVSCFIVEKFHFEGGLERFQLYVKHFQEVIVGFLFVVPILPDEIIGLGASFIKIKFSRFLCIAIVAKVISIGMIAFSDSLGEIASMQQWQIIMIEFGALLLMTRIFKYMDYRKCLQDEGYEIARVK